MSGIQPQPTAAIAARQAAYAALHATLTADVAAAIAAGALPVAEIVRLLDLVGRETVKIADGQGTL